MTMAENGDFERTTRSVFDQHHRAQDRDEQIFQRLARLIDEDYFGFEPGSLARMRVLDAGCGSNGNCSYALLRSGAGHVTALDLGDHWIAPVSRRLVGFRDRFSCVPGSVMRLPFSENTFDFAHSAGVLHHTADPKKGFEELVRVTRPCGYVFITIMATGNGLIYRCINLLRAAYRCDPSFRRSVDGLDEQQLKQALQWLLAEKSSSEPELLPGENAVFASLFDQDIILTLQDRLQAPTYHDFGFTEAQIR